MMMRVACAALFLLHLALSSHSERKWIDLLPLANTTYATWVFMSVIMLPPLSCGSIAMVPRAFDDALLRANPDVEVAAAPRSEARRLGSRACVAGACPCADTGGDEHATIVLEVETRCGVARLALPSDDEFLFVYDARTDPSRRYGLLPSFADYVLLRLVDTASVSSLTLASSSAMR
jgi:hypothetical protein